MNELGSVRPLFEDREAGIALYVGDMRELLPALSLTADLVLTDPPYAQTAFAWDRWPGGWPALVATITSSLWCFGSLRMFLDRREEFTTAGWKLSQDIVWEKHNGSGFHRDRFKRVHEHALHWYRGPWHRQHHQVPTTPDAVARTVRRTRQPGHLGEIGEGVYVSQDGGPRLMRSVIPVRSLHGRALHPTEKPVGILDPVIRYACPPGGLVVDPFAGSGSTLDAARQCGRRAIGIEADEQYADAAACRLAQGVLGRA